nr:uncharacterized protein LOC111507532 [Leptinotarsa decemlineata]
MRLGNSAGDHRHRHVNRDFFQSHLNARWSRSVTWRKRNDHRPVFQKKRHVSCVLIQRRFRSVLACKRVPFSFLFLCVDGPNVTSEAGHLIKEHSAQRVKGIGAVVEESGDDGGKSASDLLQLVRHLSHTNTSATASKEPDDVNMGANVSRHSVKGLSGRRSQSSGSICNGSGGSGSGKSSRHPDGKICGSLPNYLDERERNGACNNNRHEKSLDEVRKKI